MPATSKPCAVPTAAFDQTTRPQVNAFVALGGNLGEVRYTLAQALQSIAALPAVTLLKRSGLYQTAPMASSGPDYINAVVQIQTTRTAPHLLCALQAIEQLAGRVRSRRNAPRTLDLDILLFGAARIESPTLQIPHPRMWGRAFVLYPLAEIAPEQVSAALLRSVAEQGIKRLPDDYAWCQSLLANRLGQLGDQFNLDTSAQGNLCHAEGATRVGTRVAKHLHQQLAGAVGDQVLLGEIARGVNQ
jgi:2-amino-4-hydroxy-6-hydroxymethyldihydropteridine diphosphokinase